MLSITPYKELYYSVVKLAKASSNMSLLFPKNADVNPLLNRKELGLKYPSL